MRKFIFKFLPTQKFQLLYSQKFNQLKSNLFKLLGREKNKMALPESANQSWAIRSDTRFLRKVANCIFSSSFAMVHALMIMIFRIEKNIFVLHEVTLLLREFCKIHD